jgi:hypothetical protein
VRKLLPIANLPPRKNFGFALMLREVFPRCGSGSRQHLCDSSAMYRKRVALQREIRREHASGAIRASDCRLALTDLMRYESSPLFCFWAVSGRSHKETWAGCIVSFTTPTRSLLKASRSVSSLSLAEKPSRVLAASYLLR